MNVASLKLCKELYKLSGWGHTDSEKMWRHHLPNNQSEIKYRGEVEADNFRFRRSPEALRFRGENKFYPAYDSGYLLRKLPAQFGKRGSNSAECLRLAKDKDKDKDRYLAGYIGIDLIWGFPCEADTPEDALIKLAIELFKQGILTPSTKSLDREGKYE